MYSPITPSTVSCTPLRKVTPTTIDAHPGTASTPASTRISATMPARNDAIETDEAEVEREPQGHGRERRESVGCELQQLPVRILGHPGVAGVALVVDTGLVVADPGEHAAQVAAVFRHRAHRVERAPVDQSEVAGVHRDRHLAEARHETVEAAGDRESGAGLTGAVVAHRVDDVESLAPLLRELQRDLGRVLEIGIHDDDRLPRV